jgi:hypothetical protein
MKSDFEIELLESKYLRKINAAIFANQDNIILNLESMNKILKFWINKPHDDGYDVGAERVIYAVLQRASDLGEPNSCPVSSDLFFENDEAFIHIDLKTAQPDNNLSDHWRIPIGKNQTSYEHDIKPKGGIARPFKPSLPKYYNEKPSLTYFITILYSRVSNIFKVVNLNVSCMPNGQLSKIYNFDPLGPGKNPDDDKARFTSNECYFFKTLNNNNQNNTDKIKRILVNYINEKAVQKDFKQRFDKFLSSIEYS